MKLKIFFLLTMFLLICLNYSPISKSTLSDSEEISINLKAFEATPEVAFYFNDLENEIGFELSSVSTYKTIDYDLVYTRKTDVGTEVQDGVIGTIDNLIGDNEILKEWIPLGTCSSTGCVYYEVTSPIELNVNLYDQDDNLIYILQKNL